MVATSSLTLWNVDEYLLLEVVVTSFLSRILPLLFATVNFSELSVGSAAITGSSP